jgi:1-phosphofructokinase
MDVKLAAGPRGLEPAQAPDRAGGAAGRAFAAPRVVTFTPAPSIDKVYFLDQIRAGQVNRAARVATYFAGNGVNVARALHLAGNTVSAVLPVGRDGIGTGGGEGGLLEVIRGVEVGSPLRTNVTLVDGTGTTTNINALPASLDPDQWSRLCQVAIEEVRRIGADWFVLGGALPIDTGTGTSVDLQPLIGRMRSLGVAVCLDSPVGAGLSGWARECQPHLVKPNAEELTMMTGIPVRCLRDAVDAAALVRASGVNTVLASLGPEGILEVSGRGVLWARGPHAQVVNTTGAGDAALAGYLSVACLDRRTTGCHYEALRRAVAWGALAVRQATTVLPHIITDPSGVLVSPPGRMAGSLGLSGVGRVGPE